MLVSEYVEIAEKTDRLNPTTPMSPNYKVMPILGLAGEIGSLLAELKKRVREPQRVARVSAIRIEEELGDIIWYSATVARRAGLDFQRDVLFANLERVKDNPGLHLPLVDADDKPGKLLGDAVNREGAQIAATFESYRRHAAMSARFDTKEEALVPYLAKIWKNSGDLLETDKVDLSTNRFTGEEIEIVGQVLGDVMWYVAGFCTLYNLNLDKVATNNATKITSLFPAEGERIPTPLYDDDFPVLQQFPRVFDVNFVQTIKNTAVMLVNGVRVGDPLRDNAYEIDGYRFHDSIHLAFVAVLGWSPVMRALMKRKRKNDPRIDDVEDGARAAIVEEMIVKLAHSYAVGIDKKTLLDGEDRVSVDLLKQVATLADGLEVSGERDGAERCKYWEWDKAIREGFKIYNQLRQHEGGRVRVDLEKRSVTFCQLEEGEGERFPDCS